jgi:hypothetical protein
MWVGECAKHCRTHARAVDGNFDSRAASSGNVLGRDYPLLRGCFLEPSPTAIFRRVVPGTEFGFRGFLIELPQQSTLLRVSLSFITPNEIASVKLPFEGYRIFPRQRSGLRLGAKRTSAWGGPPRCASQRATQSPKVRYGASFYPVREGQVLAAPGRRPCVALVSEPYE